MAKKSDDDWRALRFHAADLFTPSSPVAVAELFNGRGSQVDQLFDAISERGRHAILYGEPGVGKTSIAKILRFLLPRTIKDVFYMRKAVVSNDDYRSIWNSIFRGMTFTIDRDGIPEDHNVAELYPNEIFAEDVVRELSQFSENSIPIIVIDEYQQLSDPDSSRLMSETVKAVSDEGLHATILVVGVGDSVDELVQGHASITRCSEEVLIPRMNSDEIQALLQVRVSQLGMKFEGNAKWKIIGLSKGLPSFAHALGRSSVYSAIARKSTTITESDVDQGIENAVKSSERTLKSGYEEATNSNQARAQFQQLITACALTKTDASGWFTPKDVELPFSQIMGTTKTVDNFNSSLKDFSEEKRGNILQRKGTDRSFRFRFGEPAMQPYILMKAIGAGLLDEAAMSALSSPEQGDLFST